MPLTSASLLSVWVGELWYHEQLLTVLSTFLSLLQHIDLLEPFILLLFISSEILKSMSTFSIRVLTEIHHHIWRYFPVVEVM